jgi:hypothetical protein
MYYYLYIVFFLFFIGTTSCANLNKLSQQRIKHIIQHPGTTPEMREQVNNVLFDSYKDWATTKALQFKRLHKHKCHHIKNDEMTSHALFGLYKGIQRYNGNNTFITYIEFYIKQELQQGMAKLIPINALPKTFLKKKKTAQENNKLYNIYLKPIYIGFDNYLMENTIHNCVFSNENKWLNNEDSLIFQMKIWEEIRKLPPFKMRIMYFKYSNDFEMIRTNRAIAEIMDCSINTINIHLIDIKNKLLPFIRNL